MQLGFLKPENTFRVTDNRCNPLLGKILYFLKSCGPPLINKDFPLGHNYCFKNNLHGLSFEIRLLYHLRERTSSTNLLKKSYLTKVRLMIVIVFFN